jgi:hypothetical protein
MTEDRIATANSSPIVMSASRTSFRLPKKLGKSGKVSREKNIALQKVSRALAWIPLKSIGRFLRRRLSSAQVGIAIQIMFWPSYTSLPKRATDKKHPTRPG